MPDPHGPSDDPMATRMEAEGSVGAPLEATEVDPYATALPSVAAESSKFAGPVDGSVVAEALRITETVNDPYATRFGEGDVVGGATNVSDVTGQWHDQEPGRAAPKSKAGDFRPSRYQPIKLHARGGLGEIYVALDGELNREVALKEIQERHLEHADNQFRFVFEAEVTGGLEHPGIVPVYGLGRHPDGRPYYAMRFIRGDSLKAALKKFHDAEASKAKATPDSLRHSLEFHKLLSRFVAVCRAIDYAHSRGVIHRDIKPDNIMIGSHGETLVVDWGLAKALDRPDPPEDSANPKPLRPLSGNDTSATMAGSVMGTPAFMSPEQANGEINTLGPASDIFSLGSTLYAMLVGLAPFRDMPVIPMIEKVKLAEFPPPRASSKAVPLALEAICLKAMARHAVARYPTAGALADDVERWLADDPVLAYPEPWTQRLGRWARKHKTAVAASFLVLLTASTSLAIGTVLIAREKARTEKNYRIARSAVDEMLTQVGEVELADVPQMESVRKGLLDQALGFYREFLLDRPADASSKLETGRALARLGEIRELLGLYAQAEDDDRRAITLLESSTLGDDGRRGLARAKANLGILLKKSNRFAESETFLRQALEERRALAEKFPVDREDARAASNTLYQLGTLLARLPNRSGEDEAAYRRAIQEQEAIVARPSSGVEARRELARSLNNLGILQSSADPDAARTSFDRALKIQDEIQAESAGNAGFRWQRARTWNNLANLYFRASFPEEAAPYYLKARDAFRLLTSDFPQVPDYRRELAMTLNNLGELLEVRPSEPEKPLDLFRKALDDQQRLVEEFREVSDHKLKLSITQLHIGDLLRATDPDRAMAALLEAVKLQQGLVDQYPRVPEYQATLGRTLTELASLLASRRDSEGALARLSKAIESLEKAREEDPRDIATVGHLIKARVEKARALIPLNRSADLAAEADQIARVVKDRPEGHLLAAGFLARASEIAGDATLKKDYARRAIEAIQAAIDRGANDPSALDGPDFKPLQSNPDFQKLRDRWKAKGQKAAV